MGMDVWREGKLIHSTDPVQRAKIKKVAAAVHSEPTVEMVALRTHFDEHTRSIVRVNDPLKAYSGVADDLERKGLAKRVLPPAPVEPIEEIDPAGDPDADLPADDEQPEPGPSARKVDGPSKRKGRKKG